MNEWLLSSALDSAHLETDEFKYIFDGTRGVRDMTSDAVAIRGYRTRILERIDDLSISVADYIERLRIDTQEREYAGGPIAAQIPRIPHESAIYRWRKKRTDITSLGRRVGGTGAKPKIANWQGAFVLEKLFCCWGASASGITRELRKFGAYHGFSCPSDSTIRRFVRALRARGGLMDVATKFRQGRYYSIYRLAVRHVYEYSNQLWQTDGTKLKIQVLDEVRKQIVEPQLLLTVDCYSGLPIGWTLVSGDPNSADNIQHLRACLLPKSGAAFWGGRPETIQSDNAKIYESADFLAATAELGINLRKSPPYCPSANGSIERLNQTVKGSLRDQFVGHLQKRGKLSARDHRFVGTMNSLREHLDAWMIDYGYTHRRKGDSEPLFERWHSGLRKQDDASIDASAVDHACLVTQELTVCRDGVKVAGLLFTSPELEAVIGTKVKVRANADGEPNIVIARIRGTDFRLHRNLKADGTLAVYGKDPRAFSADTARRMCKAIRSAGLKDMAAHTPANAANMKLRKPRLSDGDSQLPPSISLPSIRKSSISTDQ